jgi:hypothetical protein
MTIMARCSLRHRYCPNNLTTYYLGDVKELVDEGHEAIEEGYDLLHSDAYTLYGNALDFCPSSNGIFFFF